MIDEDYLITHLMLKSNEYANLRYDFDECTEDSVAPLLDTKHYAICDKDMAVLHVNLDGDGVREQIAYLQRKPTEFDVRTNKRY